LAHRVQRGVPLVDSPFESGPVHGTRKPHQHDRPGDRSHQREMAEGGLYPGRAERDAGLQGGRIEVDKRRLTQEQENQNDRLYHGGPPR